MGVVIDIKGYDMVLFHCFCTDGGRIRSSKSGDALFGIDFLEIHDALITGLGLRQDTITLPSMGP